MPWVRRGSKRKGLVKICPSTYSLESQEPDIFFLEEINVSNLFTLPVDYIL